MLMRLAAIAALSTLAGCLGPAEFRGWSEREYKFTNCTGAASVSTCHEQARVLCPEGYQLAEERSDPEIKRYSIIVKCGAPPPAVEEPSPRPRTRRAAPAPATPK